MKKTTWFAVTGSVVGLLVSGVCAQDESQETKPKPTIALFAVNTDQGSEADAGYVLGMVRNYLVNTELFRVLEQSQASRYAGSVVSEADAIAAGRALKVDKVYLCSAMDLGGEYFMEIRVIDVATSSIEKSRTGRCADRGELAYMTKKIVERICGVEISSDAIAPLMTDPSRVTVTSEQTDDHYYGLSKGGNATGGDPVRALRAAQAFRMLGFPSVAYRRYIASGMDGAAWIDHEKRNPLTAAALGAVPVASGLFYTGDYALGAFLTTIKVVSLIGLIPFAGKSGDDMGGTWLFSATLAAATAGDIAGSYVAARNSNDRLSRLSKVKGFADVGGGRVGGGLALTF